MVKNSLVIMLFSTSEMFILKTLKLFMVKNRGKNEVFSAIRIGFSTKEYFLAQKNWRFEH